MLNSRWINWKCLILHVIYMPKAKKSVRCWWQNPRIAYKECWATFSNYQHYLIKWSNRIVLSIKGFYNIIAISLNISTLQTLMKCFTWSVFSSTSCSLSFSVKELHWDFINFPRSSFGFQVLIGESIKFHVIRLIRFFFFFPLFTCDNNQSQRVINVVTTSTTTITHIKKMISEF